MRTLKILFFLISFVSYGQFEYEPSNEYPFGRPNPEAPEQITDFQPMIGECDCKSETRKQDGNWNTPVDMLWRFKYILNGMGVQDETFKDDGTYAGSIRQFIADSSKWYVHYYTTGSSSTVLPAWEGNKQKDGRIILYRDQKAPNGMEGYYRLTFYDMSETGYKWIGEWVDKGETIIYPTWKIECTKKDK